MQQGAVKSNQNIFSMQATWVSLKFNSVCSPSVLAHTNTLPQNHNVKIGNVNDYLSIFFN